MAQRIGLLLLICVALGCEPRPAPSMPVGTHGPSGSLVTPEPEHRRLLALKQPTPAEQAQLMLYEAYQARGNKRKGLDRAQCEFFARGCLPGASAVEFRSALQIADCTDQVGRAHQGRSRYSHGNFAGAQ